MESGIKYSDIRFSVRQEITQHELRERAHIVIAQLLLITAVFVLYNWYPLIYIRFIAEDNWGEYASFPAFILAGVLFFTLFYNSVSKLKDIWFILLSVAMLFIAMEEISWGQRIFELRTPGILSEINYQKEINLHNITAFSPGGVIYSIVSVMLCIYGCIAPVAVKYIPLIKKIVDKINLPLPSLSLSPLYVATAYFLSFSNLVKAEEIGETLFGITFGCTAILMMLNKSRFEISALPMLKSEKVYLFSYVFGSFFIGIMLTTTLESGKIKDEGKLSQYDRRLNDFASALLPEQGDNRQAMIVYRYLDKHPEKIDQYYDINKARFLKRIGKKKAAQKQMQIALNKLQILYAKSPADPDIAIRLAVLYSDMNMQNHAKRYLQEAFGAYDKATWSKTSSASKSNVMVGGIGTLNPGSQLAKRHIFRAVAYGKLGYYQEGIDEYLQASYYVSKAINRKKVKTGINILMHKFCQTGYEDISWDDIESLAKERAGSAESKSVCRSSTDS